MDRPQLITVNEAEMLHDYQLNEGGMIAKGIDKYNITLLTPYKNALDDMFMMLYSSFKLNVFYTDYKEQIPDYIAIYLQSEEYNLKTLIGTLNLEYNPIENYNMVEHGTSLDIHNNDKRVTNGSNTIGERTTSGTSTTGKQHSSGTNTDALAPMNNTTFYNQEQNSINTNVDERQDSVSTSTEAATDTFTNTTNATEDSIDHAHDLTRTGNVGVTTSQQMIESERNLANINIVQIICRKIANLICEGVQVIL